MKATRKFMESILEGMTSFDALREVEALADESMIWGITEEERKLIGLIREKQDQRVLAHVRKGHIVRVAVEEELEIPEGGYSGEQLVAVLETKDFATLTIGKRAGEIARMNLLTPIKIDKDTGRTRILPTGESEC